MSRVSEEPTSRIHIHLFTSDIAFMKLHYGGNVGFSRALRSIIRDYRKRIEASAAEKNRTLSGDLPEDLGL